MRKLQALLVTLALGCGSTPTDGTNPGGGADMSSGAMNPDGGTDPGPGTTIELAGTLSGARSLSGDVLITDNLTIDAGATLTLAAGTMLRVAAGKQIAVRGTLAANGTVEKTVGFAAQKPTGAEDWSGLAVYGGGALVLRNTSIRNAKVGVQAAPGSSFDIDGALIESSSAIAYLNSSGTIKYSVLHALGAKQSGDAVIITDASPKISDTVIDNSNGGSDMIAVNGPTSGPLFDHVEVTGSHCAFHLNSGSRITISGSVVRNNVYGMMVVGSKNTLVTGNNFTQNDINIGTCAGGSVTATGNFFVGEIFEASCANQTATGAQNSPLPAVGPRPRP